MTSHPRIVSVRAKGPPWAAYCPERPEILKQFAATEEEAIALIAARLGPPYFHTCPDCDGAGYHRDQLTGLDGDPDAEWLDTDCERCWGTGEIEAEE